ncbi:hypothetical protein M427DRAFT_402503 [Gonapodya prolifera JEL478]|uniref:Uncharacterized protein n=1 Tax=Gonapodya prolifera (strain JEL478) TaxID=1344416 RepID=A0A139AU58_GONPJ|nr:hypothetical protein M427DRAFT_402503 [Gonapodya prolifera JEL478]|eukprot:KXS20113.1 hypothetical protein M427DRAFT_402503 [Gonapodya prolifera JEL478]
MGDPDASTAFLTESLRGGDDCDWWISSESVEVDFSKEPLGRGGQGTVWLGIFGKLQKSRLRRGMRWRMWAVDRRRKSKRRSWTSKTNSMRGGVSKSIRMSLAFLVRASLICPQHQENRVLCRSLLHSLRNMAMHTVPRASEKAWGGGRQD